MLNVYLRLQTFNIRLIENTGLHLHKILFTLKKTTMNGLTNSVRLHGHLGQDPEIKKFDNNKKVAKFTLATNENFKNEKGEKVKETTWHNIIAWGTTAGIIEKYLKKGSEITLEGRIQNRQYTDKDGVKKNYSEVVLNEMLMVGKKD